MADEMPDYTDPDDQSRLRAVFSPYGWTPDRDDPDLVKLGVLYARMDDLCERWSTSTDIEPVLWGDAVAEIWIKIRALQREA